MTMSKTMKKGLMIAGCVIVGIALVFGIMMLVRNVSRKPVPVYEVSAVSTTGDSSWATTTQGTVSSQGIQKVYSTSTRTVTEILVKQGDTVKKGDALLTYDTTLTDIDVKKAAVALGKLQLQKSEAEKQLSQLRAMKPHSTITVTIGEDAVYTPHETPYIIQGNGSQDHPFIILWSTTDNLTVSYAQWLVQMHIAADPSKKTDDPTNPGESGTNTSAAEDSDTDGDNDNSSDDGNFDPEKVYVALITRQNNAMNAQITERYGVLINAPGGTVESFDFFEPVIPDEIEKYDAGKQTYTEDVGSYYTAAELNQMRTEKAQEIKDLEVQIGLAQIEYDSKAEEAGDGTVYAQFDGIVTSVADDIDAAMQNNKAVLEVSDGGGYYITGTMGEFDLQNVQVGSTVQIIAYDWQSGNQSAFEGKITRISDYPVTNNNSYYSDNNANVSYYEFTVFVEGSAEMSDDSYVQISYGQSGDSDDLYLSNAFIRTEGGQSYVYVKGDNDRLEKRVVQVGRDMWGSYTQIRSGLSVSDYVAFPYGNDVFAGAKTTVADEESLYSSIYY